MVRHLFEAVTIVEADWLCIDREANTTDIYCDGEKGEKKRPSISRPVSSEVLQTRESLGQGMTSAKRRIASTDFDNLMNLIPFNLLFNFSAGNANTHKKTDAEASVLSSKLTGSD